MAGALVLVSLPFDAGGLAGSVVCPGVGGVALLERSGRAKGAQGRVVHREGERPLLPGLPYRSESPSRRTGPVVLGSRSFPASSPPLSPLWLVFLVAPGQVGFGSLRRPVGRRKRALRRWLVGISLAWAPAITLPTLLRRWPIRVASVPSLSSVLLTRWVGWTKSAPIRRLAERVLGG